MKDYNQDDLLDAWFAYNGELSYEEFESKWVKSHNDIQEIDYSEFDKQECLKEMTACGREW